MEPTSCGRNVIDIGKSVRKHPDALSGCDSVARYHGIGKPTAVKALVKRSLEHLVNIDSRMDDIIQEATDFIGLCYGIPPGEDMSIKRYKAWGRKSPAGKKLKSAPILELLPPTKESFTLNVKRAHFQCPFWLHALCTDPPLLDPVEYGWSKDDVNKSLVPVMLPGDVESFPPEVLKMIACNCLAEMPCGHGNCTCLKNIWIFHIL